MRIGRTEPKELLVSRAGWVELEGMCDAAAFSTDGVTAHWAGEGNEMWPGKTIFLIRFKESVVEREEAIKAGTG